MSWLGKILGVRRLASEVQENVFEARVASMTLTYEGRSMPISDLHELVPVIQQRRQHLETCMNMESHGIVLVVQHDEFPWGATQSFVHVKDPENGVLPVFVLTRQVDGMFMMDPRLGDRWGELQLAADGGTKLVVSDCPVDASYYNY